jgi:hypothetical protein
MCGCKAHQNRAAGCTCVCSEHDGWLKENIRYRIPEIRIYLKSTTATWPRPCKVCGHPYDHNGQPHTAAEDRRRHRGQIPHGEALTGPDGNAYYWDQQVNFWSRSIPRGR